MTESSAAAPPPSRVTFIPVASGKGGVGKSLVTANLALCLARRGHPTVAVDLDLGGSNLHSYLGLGNGHPGLGEALNPGGPALERLLVATAQPGLRLLPGDGGLPFLANLGHAQKLKLLKGLQGLPARFVVLDLGAGSTFNTLDYFLLSPAGLLVSTPEMPALLNLMTFLKHLVLRVVAQEVSREAPLKALLAQQRLAGARHPARTVAELLRQISQVDATAGVRVQQRLARFTPRLVLNMGEHPDDLEMLRPVARNLAERLSVNLEGFGFIHFDPRVRLAVRERRPLMTAFPDSLAARGIDRIADRILRLWDEPLVDSLERLATDTRGVHARWQQAAASVAREGDHS